jgi:hypothetical protein
MVIFERPVVVRSAGRWAADAHDVTAEEESPISAARIGRISDFMILKDKSKFVILKLAMFRYFRYFYILWGSCFEMQCIRKRT